MPATVSDTQESNQRTGLVPFQVIDGAVYAASSVIAPFTDMDGVHHPDYRSGLVALVYEKEYAHVFAAAPELLAAAKSALDTVACIRENWPEEEGILKTLDDWLVRDLRAAIAKAEGR